MKHKWKNSIVTGEEKPSKPELIVFNNSAIALKMIHDCISNEGHIGVHCDVDVDGIGSGYEISRFLITQTKIPVTYIINKDKIHGIQKKHADYFADKQLDLLIIVDSSSNDIDIIKQFNCNVLVIDHHELSHNELHGHTNDGKHEFIIVNNTVSNSELSEIECLIRQNNNTASEKLSIYEADDRMSCGLVVYELLRVYCKAYQLGDILDNLRLYQWVGVTLFTDAILLNTPRNQWYIENTVHSNEIESTLGKMLAVLNPFKITLDKSLINYTIAPVINRAIRAGHSGDALNCVLFYPDKIGSLLVHRQAQDEAVKVGVSDIRAYESYIIKDMSSTNIHKNYNGVIASRLCGENNKNTVVYHVTDGIAEGSFRGRISGVDYREVIDKYDDTTWAQGHKTAFGFKCPEIKLSGILDKLREEESNISDKKLLTAGSLNNIEPGEFIIEDMDEFKKQGGIWKLGIGNSKVSTDEQILITVSSSDASLVEQKGKLYIYNVLGLVCKAFEPITKPIINIYVEYSKQIDCYIK